MSKITRNCAVAFSLAACSLSASADVMIRSKLSITGMMSMQGESVTYIKGHKMRIESQMGKQSSVMLMDLDARKTIILDGNKAQAFDLTKLMQQQTVISETSVQFDVKPTGKKREVAGKSCDEYDMTIKVADFSKF